MASTAQAGLFEPRRAMPPFHRWLVQQRDANDLLSHLPAGSVDCIVTDVAYESLEKHRAKGTTTRLKVSDGSSNEWFPIFRNERFPQFFDQAHRALAKNAHLYFYCDVETMRVAIPVAEAAGFTFWKPIVWDKVSIGMGYHYRSRYELILFFEKGKRKLNDLGVPDIITEKRVRDGYPTEKPWKVSDVLIRQSTDPGQLVLDPFCGSGSVGVAALQAGRRFLGGDVQEKAVTLATNRLRTLVETGGTP